MWKEIVMGFRKLLNSLKFSYKFDDDLPRKFVKKILIDSEDSSKILVDTIQQSIDSPPKIKITKEITIEVATAVLGVSIGLMHSGGSGLLSAAQGKKVEKLCRRSIDKDFGYTLKESNHINKKIDEYIEAYKESWSLKTNPFNRPAGILLMNIVGKNYKSVMTAEGTLQYLVHQMVMDQLMLMIVEPNRMWKM